MKIRKYIRMIVGLALLSVGMGCTGWLDVEPVDRVTEEQLYSTEAGFKQSLNGIYVDLNSTSLYGGELLVNTVEILAQRYEFTSSNSKQNQFDMANFKFTTDYSKLCFAGIWEKAYALIANVNVLLENAEGHKDVFTGDHYNIITGEAYALRAMLHFDLLRLFGPVYKTAKEAESICYNTDFQLSGSTLLPAAEVVELILKDLEEAEKRLADDPVIENGPMVRDGGEDLEEFMRYRTLRLNYYAVKGLEARVSLYAGLSDRALAAAREVVAVQEKYYPFLEYSQIVGNSKSPDRVFSSELLFALQNSRRNSIFETYFTPELNGEQIYKVPTAFLDRIFGPLARSDRRYEPIWLNSSRHEFRTFHKYEEVRTSALYGTMVPMLRMSEMYYIIAETSADDAEAIEAMNLVLVNRGLKQLDTREAVNAALQGEYQKEFWGEGQLFFYYKRINAEKIPSALRNEDIEMTESNYVLPLPESETNYR